MIKAKMTHNGQYRRYGDSFKEWDIETDEPKEDVLAYCFKELYKYEVPEETEWRKTIREGDLFEKGLGSYYFSGYYTLKKTQDGYHFTVCLPFTD